MRVNIVNQRKEEDDDDDYVDVNVDDDDDDDDDDDEDVDDDIDEGDDQEYEWPMLAAWHRPWRLRRRAVAVQRERWVSGKQHGTAQLAQLAHFHEDVGDVVMALAKETRWQHAVELARRQPYWRTYQNAIEACRRGLQWDWCVQLLKEMQIHSYRPGATAYGMVASTLGRSTQWSKALQVIQDMKGGDVPLNLKIFSAVLSGCGQAKEWQVAISVLADAEQHQLQLDTVSCNAAMTACKHSTWEVCQYLLRSMALRQLKPSVVTLAQLVESYGHGMRWAEALETLQGAHRFSLQPDVVLINATAAAVVRGSGWPSALSLFEELPTRSLRADLVTANTLLTTWQVASGWQETLQVLQSFPRWSLRPTTISYNTTMTSALRGQHWPLVLELMAEMRQRKLQFSDSSFNVLASVYEQNSAWEDALQCLAVADQEGLQLSSLTMAVVVSACRKAMQWQQVMALLEDLQDSHLDDVFRAAHMASCVDAGDLPSALAAYRELPLRGARARQEWYVLDLHDLQPEEARLAVRCALLDLVQPKPWPPSGLTFITGRGRHSEGGQSILQPAVLQLLQELQVEAHQNEGRVRIPLRSLMDFVGGIKSVLRDESLKPIMNLKTNAKACTVALEIVRWVGCAMSNTISEKLDGFTFHRSNIHERRRLATFARLFPLFCFLGVVACAAVSFALSERMLWGTPRWRRWLAVLNVSLCLGMSYSGLLCLLGIRKVAQELRSEAVEVVQERRSDDWNWGELGQKPNFETEVMGKYSVKLCACQIQHSPTMFARIIALVFVAAAGRRHTESLDQLKPEEVVEKVEEKTIEAIESISPPVGGDDGKLIPLSASFQVAPTMGEMPVKTKLTLSLSHEPSPAADSLSIICHLTAKDAAAAEKFAEEMTGLWLMALSMSPSPSSVFLNFTSKGRRVEAKMFNIPKPPTSMDSAKRMADSIGHVNVTVDVESDMQEILAHLSNETVLYEEVYKGFRYSVDATLTRALEKMATAYATPTNPQVPGPAVVIRKLFSLLTGASADVKVAFDDTVRQELIRSMPVLNMKYGTLVAMYKQMVTQFPVAWRGSPIAKKLLDVLHSMESIETLDTVELTGIPDLKVLAVSNSTAGAFEFTAKLLKDAGVEGVLLNTTAPVVIPVTLPPELADLAKPNGSS
eukprot:s288_g9.t1